MAVQELSEHKNPDVRATLVPPRVVYVDKMPPVPPRLWVEVTIRLRIENGSRHDETLFAPTPCDVVHWRLLDDKKCVIQNEPPQICAQHVVTLNLPAGTAVSSAKAIQLDGNLLEDEKRYYIEGSHWGYPCTGDFVAKIVV